MESILLEMSGLIYNGVITYETVKMYTDENEIADTKRSRSMNFQVCSDGI